MVVDVASSDGVGGGGDDGIYVEALSSVALRTITIVLAGSKILVVMRSSEYFCSKSVNDRWYSRPMIKRGYVPMNKHEQ